MTDAVVWEGAEGLRALLVPIADLKYAERNPMVHTDHNLRVIADSLGEHGQLKNITVAKDNEVAAGNGTLYAATEMLGWTHVAAVVYDAPVEAVRRFMIQDNAAGRLAMWDEDVLKIDLAAEKERLGDAFDGETLGFTPEQIENWLPPAPDVTDQDLDDPLEGDAKMKPGDAKLRDADKAGGYTRMVQVLVASDEWDEFVQLIKALAPKLGTETTSDTIIACVKQVHAELEA